MTASEDPTQGREVGSEPYEDPTEGREVGSNPEEASSIMWGARIFQLTKCASASGMGAPVSGL